MARLGIRQLELMRACGTCRAILVGDRMTDRLCELGMMKSHSRDGNGVVALTPAGLRALADAAEAGRIDIFTMPERKPEEADG